MTDSTSTSDEPTAPPALRQLAVFVHDGSHSMTVEVEPESSLETFGVEQFAATQDQGRGGRVGGARVPAEGAPQGREPQLRLRPSTTESSVVSMAGYAQLSLIARATSYAPESAHVLR